MEIKPEKAELPVSSNERASILFFNDYRTLGLFSRSPETNEGTIISMDLSLEKGIAVSMENGKLMIAKNTTDLDQLKEIPFIPSSMYILINADACVIGTGDIRNLTHQPDDGHLDLVDLKNGEVVVLHYNEPEGNLFVYHRNVIHYHIIDAG